MLKRFSLLLITLLFIPTALQAATNGPSVSSQPAFPNKILPGQFSFELKPGTSGQETVEIINQSTQSITYFINGVDSFVSNKGEIAFNIATDPQKVVGNWIIPESKKITLNPEEKARINFTVSVPKNAEYKSYLGGLSIEVQNIGTTVNNGMKVAVNIRKIERINIKVTDNPQPIEKRPPPSLPWTQIYFFASLAVFLLAVLYISFSQIKKHRARRHARKAAASHPEHPAHPAHPVHHEKK